jgi:DNA-binding transcriptional LysR family regulator
MKLRQLQQFIGVAETLNFREAADRLHMAQPPLSASVRRLESELGGALFERSSGSSVRLTAAGQAMLPQARHALLAAERCREAFYDAQSGQRGMLRIGFVGSATSQLLPAVMAAARAGLPKVQLALKEEATVSILQELQAGRMDIGLVRSPVFETGPFQLDLLAIDEFMLAVPAAHPLASRGGVALARVAEMPFTMYSSTGIPNLHALCMMLCQNAGFVPRVAQEATQMLTMLSLVRAGVGVALLPSSALPYVPPQVKFLRLTDTLPGFRTGIALATLAGPERSPLVENFRRLVLAAAAGKPPGPVGASSGRRALASPGLA